MMSMFVEEACTGNMTCRVMTSLFLDMFTSFLWLTSILHFCALTVDRYIHLFYAMMYHQIVTYTRLKRAISALWLIGFITSFIQVTWLCPQLWNIDAHSLNSNLMSIFAYEAVYSASIFFLFLIIPVFLLAILFVRMFLDIRSKILQENVTSYTGKTTIGPSARQGRVLINFGLMFTLNM